MITKELKIKVIEECKLLRKYIAKSERNRLIKSKLDSNSATNCIYGLMTTHCNSERAIDLLNKCAVPYSDCIEYKERPCPLPFTPLTRRGIVRVNQLSALEYYISRPGAKNDLIIKYLKGKIN